MTKKRLKGKNQTVYNLTCLYCQTPFSAKRPDALYDRPECRKLASRHGKAPRGAYRKLARPAIQPAAKRRSKLLSDGMPNHPLT